MIELQRQHNDRVLDLQTAARDAEDALEEAKESQYRQLQEPDRSQQEALVNHHSQAFVETLKQLEGRRSSPASVRSAPSRPLSN